MMATSSSTKSKNTVVTNPLPLPLPSIDPDSGFCSSNGIYYSKRPPLPVLSQTFLSLPEYVLFHRKNNQEEDSGVIAYIDTESGRSITYGELRSEVLAMAEALSSFGVQQGDVLLLVLPNTIRFASIMLGAMMVGAAVTTANPLNTLPEIERQAKNSAAAFAIVTPNSPLLERKRLNKKLRLIVFDLDDEKELTSLPEEPLLFVNGIISPQEGSVSLSNLLLHSPPTTRTPAIRIKQDDTAALLYSSGTTGESKGVILCHKHLIGHAQIFQNLRELSSNPSQKNPVYLCFVPLFHIFGFALFCSSLLAARCTVVVMPKFNFAQMLASIQKYRVTHLPVVPPIVIALAKSNIIYNYDLSSITDMISGAAPLSKEIVDVFRARFPKVIVGQGYGLTESTGAGVHTITREESENIASTGLLAPSMEARIVDEDSNPLPPNQRGELWLRGPIIMKGYFGNPGATAATIDAEGWLHTGDVCYIDRNGFLYVVDRLKELIKYKGFQVAPAELESVLLSHPNIIDAAVIPYPDEEAGQIPMAFVVRIPGSALTESSVIKFVADKVARYKSVRRVAFVTEIPKSTSGKILRRELVAKASSRL